MRKKGIRHGDLLLVKISELPKGLKQEKSNVIMRGSHGHDHSFNTGELYLKKENKFVFGYFKAYKGTKLFHPEHGEVVINSELRECDIPEGYYELRVQHEDTNDGIKQVID